MVVDRRKPMSVALRQCPHAVVMPVRFARYREISRKLFAIFESCTPWVEPLSLDEAFLDVTDSQRLLGLPDQIAVQIKEHIRSSTGLTASVGIAPNKFLAKIASDMRRPDGLVSIESKDVESMLSALP